MGSLGQLYIVPLRFLYGLFTQPCSIGCGRFERSISECKRIRLKMWMRSLVQENPPTSNRDGVGKNASSFYKWFPIVRPFRRKLL